jgi:proteasome lid subunit RPN8/RPN11
MFLLLTIAAIRGIMFLGGGDVREDEYSHKGLDRKTQVNRAYIESNEFKRKFDNATDNPTVNKVLYDSAKEMLYDRSGTRYESMRWIDGDSGKIIAKAEYMGKQDKYKGEAYEERVLYDDNKLKRQLSGHNKIITIHNHPNSTTPSTSDLNSTAKRGYSVGFVVTHDGRLYKYTAEEEINHKVFDMTMTKYINDGYNVNEAQILAYENISNNTKINVKEVLRWI